MFTGPTDGEPTASSLVPGSELRKTGGVDRFLEALRAGGRADAERALRGEVDSALWQVSPSIDEIRIVMIRGNGTLYARRIFFYIATHMAGQTAYVIEDIDRVQIFDDRGTLIIENPGHQ